MARAVVATVGVGALAVMEVQRVVEETAAAVTVAAAMAAEKVEVEPGVTKAVVATEVEMGVAAEGAVKVTVRWAAGSSRQAAQTPSPRKRRGCDPTWTR